MGIQMASAYIGAALMPPVFGWLASYMGFAIFPVFIGVILIAKVVMVGRVYREVDRIM
jgi:fucose permease